MLVRAKHTVIRQLRTRQHRRLRHNAVILLSTALLVMVLVLVVPDRRLLAALSIATAYTALVLLGATLAVGPVALLRGRKSPLSSDLRRDLGISVAVFGILHSGLGLQLHGKHWWEYFLKVSAEGEIGGIRLDAFSVTNYAGLTAAVMLLGLLTISSDRALAQLGVSTWKQWQRTTYIVAPLTILHGLAYQLIEHRAAVGFGIVLSTSALICTLQVLGRRRWSLSQI